MPTPNNLQNLGLSTDQTAIYLTLLNSGPQSAISLAKLSGIKRTYIYHLCKELEKEGHIKLTQKGRTTYFSAQSPDLLLAKAQEKKAQAETALLTLQSILPELQSKYRLTDIKPVVSYFEGLEGIKKMYQDIIKTGQDDLLFRSIHDESNPLAATVLYKHMEERTKAGIRTKAITPFVEVGIQNYLHHDKEHLFERHFTQNPKYLFPCQIIVYGTKVAITDFQTLITTTLDNLLISQTFSQLFDILWEATQNEHDDLIRKISSNPPKTN